MAETADPAKTPAGGFRTLIRFLPMLWPKGEAELKARVAGAILLVLAGKAITIAMSYPLKLAVDRMSAHAPVAIVTGLVLAYCAARFGGVLSDLSLIHI